MKSIPLSEKNYNFPKDEDIKFKFAANNTGNYFVFSLEFTEYVQKYIRIDGFRIKFANNENPDLHFYEIYNIEEIRSLSKYFTPFKTLSDIFIDLIDILKLGLIELYENKNNIAFIISTNKAFEFKYKIPFILMLDSNHHKSSLNLINSINSKDITNDTCFSLNINSDENEKSEKSDSKTHKFIGYKRERFFEENKECKNDYYLDSERKNKFFNIDKTNNDSDNLDYSRKISNEENFGSFDEIL